MKSEEGNRIRNQEHLTLRQVRKGKRERNEQLEASCEEVNAKGTNERVAQIGAGED
jgi:hypothetical protein